MPDETRNHRSLTDDIFFEPATGTIRDEAAVMTCFAQYRLAEKDRAFLNERSPNNYTADFMTRVRALELKHSNSRGSKLKPPVEEAK